jgi:hypothetical protein
MAIAPRETSSNKNIINMTNKISGHKPTSVANNILRELLERN